jgi:dipeptidyl aminopeptidase/acylaminoacyl peptidase
MRTKGWFGKGVASSTYPLAAAAWFALAGSAQTVPAKYEKPPQAILDVLNAPVTPLLSLSPARDVALLYTPMLYPPIADLAQPMLRLAGVRINPANNGPHGATRFNGYVLKRIADGREIHVTLPSDANLSPPIWAPDGRRFAFTNLSRTSVELRVGDASTGAAQAIAGLRLNSALGPPCQWLPDSSSLLCLTVPAGRGALPTPNPVPAGPHVQESFGKAAPQPTYEDLLLNSFDEKLFDYYATAQMEIVSLPPLKPGSKLGASGAKSTPLGQPAIFRNIEAAPDGQHILVERIRHPYSYLVPFEDFPCDIEVWNRTGQVVYKVASLPLHETTPLGGVPEGPRDLSWQSTAPARLVWVEALDEGNPRKKVTPRDRVMAIDVASLTPGTAPSEWFKTEERFTGIAWGERGDLALAWDYVRDQQRRRGYFFDPKQPAASMRLVWDLSVQERYKNPGRLVMRILPNGQPAMAEDGGDIFLDGEGASPEGNRPFLDRFNVKNFQSTRLFHSDERSYETFIGLLAPDGSKFLTRHETPTDPANYFIRTASGNGAAFTHFPNRVPQLAGIKKELVKYQRADGVGLSMTLYLPPDYQPGQRLPAVMWAYPFEYTSAALASQVTGSPNTFTEIRGPSQLFFLLEGYAVLENAAMPVVGDPETMNNTYVEQIVADAKAAIDKAADMGVVDPTRVGVGGHSYGAFMTANLLAHSDLFRAGIARSGAYNRTLTPFTFQSERRTLWEAPDVYLKMSPFMYADKIKAPILLIHGEADNNSGTFPIQSERMYRAIKGNGGSVRYVTLPDEAHGYAARETIEHVLWEMLTWFDRYVKNAPPVTAPPNEGGH